MKILTTKPPIYERLHELFGVEWEKGLVITYFPDIYTKSGTLTEDLFIHESTHLRQQEKMGVDKWWSRYISDVSFRLQEETAAYMMQIKFIRENTASTSRNERRLRIRHIVSSMARLYGFQLTEEQVKKILNI